MTQITWKTGISAQWGTATNWVGGVPNSTTADVIIGTGGSYTVTIAAGSSFTVDSVTESNNSAGFYLLGGLNLGGTAADFLFDGAVFTLGATGIISGGTLDIDHGILSNKGGSIATKSFILGSSGSIALGGTVLTIPGSAALSGVVYGNNSAGSSLVVTGAAVLSGLTVENRATLVDAGSIMQTGALQLGDAANDVSGLLINAGAVFEIAASSAISPDGSIGITNAGLLQADAGVQAQVIPYLTNTGTILAAAGADIAIGSGMIGGKLTGAGEIDFAIAQFTLAAGLVANVATLGIDNGASVTLAAATSISSNLLLSQNGTIGLNGHNLTLSNASLGGSINGGGVVDITGNGQIGNLALNGNTTLLVAGTVTQTNSNLYLGNSSTDTSSLTIATGGTFSISNNLQLGSGNTGSVVNEGVFISIAPPLSDNVIDAAFINMGTVDVVSGILDIQDGGTIGGVFTGSGELVFNGTSAYTLSPILVLDVGTVGIDGATVTFGSSNAPSDLSVINGVLSLAGNVSLNEFTMNDGQVLLNGYNLTLTGNSGIFSGGYSGTNDYFNGSASLVGHGSIIFDGQNNLFGSNGYYGYYSYGTYIDSGVTVFIAGDVTQTGASFNPNVIQLSGTIVVDQTGTYNILSGSGINGGTIENNGTIVSSGSGFDNTVDATVDSTGTIESDTGTLQLAQGGSIGGVLTGAGEIDLVSGNFTLAPGLAVSVGVLGIESTTSLAGNVSIAGNLSFNSTLLLDGYTAAISGGAYLAGTVAGPGTVAVAGTAVLNNLSFVGGAALLDAGSITQTGAVSLGNGIFDSDALIITAGATYDLENIGGFGPGIAAQGAATILNGGFFEVNGFAYNGYGNVIAPNVTNTGTLDLFNAGITTMAGSLTNDGLVIISHGTLLANGPVSTDAGATGTILLGAGAVFAAAGVVDAHQTIAFAGAGGVLELAAATSFAGTINGFATGDVIDLGNIAANGYSFVNNQLVLTEATNGGAASIITTLAISAAAGTFGLVADGFGGTDIVLNHPGTTFSNPKTAIVEADWNGATAAWTTAADWSSKAVPGANNNADYFGGANFTVSYNTTDTVNMLEFGNSGGKFALNGGTLTVNDGGYWSGVFSNTAGVLDVATGYTFNGATTLASAATLITDSGDTVFDGGGTLAGLLAGAGTISLSAGSYQLNAGLKTTVADFIVGPNASVGLGAAQSFSSTFDFLGASLNLHSQSATFSGTAILGGAYYYQSTVIDGGGSLLVTGSAALTNLTMYGNTSLVDAGTIVQDAALSLGNTASDASALTINSGAVYDLDDAALTNNIYESGSLAVTNAGLFEMLGYGNDVNSVNAAFNNTGTLLGGEGDLRLNGGGTIGGTLAGAGFIDLAGGIFTLVPTASFAVAGLGLDSTIVLGGNVTLADQTVYGSNGNIYLKGYTLTLAGGADLGNGSSENIYGTGTLKVTGSSTFDNVYIYGTTNSTGAGAVLLDDAGTLIQSGQIYLDPTNDTKDTSSILIEAGAVYNINSSGAAISSSGANPANTITNNGLLEYTGTASAYIGVAVYNSRTIAVSSGELQLQGGGTLGGTLTGAGELDLGNNATFILMPSVAITVATLALDSGAIDLVGSVIDTGTFDLNGGYVALQGRNMTLAGQATFGGNAGFVQTGTVLVTGTATISPLTSEFNVDSGAVLEDAGTIIQNGALYLGLYGNGTLAVDAGGTYDIVSNAANGIYTHFAGIIKNAGLFELTGAATATLDDVDVTLQNTGTMLAASGTLELDLLSNDKSGTLTGGTWEATATSLSTGTLWLDNDPQITTDAANIILAGTGAEIITGTNPPATLEASLTSITSAGTLQNLARNYLTGNIITDAGVITLGGGTFAPAALVIAAGGALSGFGTLAAPVANNGAIAALGTLTLAAPVSGAGSLAIGAGDNLVLGAGIGATETIAFTGAGAVLTLDAPTAMAATLAGFAAGDVIDIATTTVSAVALSGANLLVTLAGGAVLDYALATLPPTNLRFGIHADGATGSDLGLYREATAAITPNPLAFGNYHVGDLAAAGLTISNTQIADGASEALDGSFSSSIGGITANGSFATLAAGASTTLGIGLLTTTAGSIAAAAVVTLSSDGAGVDGDAPVSLGSTTIAVTGAVYAYAAASLASSITFANAHVGSADSAVLTITDSTTNAAYTEALDAAFTGATGAAVDAGSVSLLGAGASSTSLSAGLATGTAGALTGTTVLGLVSDGTGIDGLGTTALASQTISLSGAVFNYASATTAGTTTAGTISLGQRHAGSTLAQAITLANTAPAGAYSEGLDAKFGSITASSGSLSGSGSITTLAAGASNTTGLVLQMGTAAGSLAGIAVIQLTSDGKGIDTLGTTALASQTIAITGAVFNYATAALTPAATLSLGQHHVGTAATLNLTVKNSAAAGLYSEKLDAKFSGTSLTTGSFTTGGTISTLAAGSSGTLAVTLAGAAGVIAGKATLALTSDGSGVDTLGNTALLSQTVAVTGTLFNEATASLAAGTLSLGQHHVGDSATSFITITDHAAAGLYSEKLDAKFSGSSIASGSFTTAGTVTTLAAGSSNASGLSVILATGTAGAVAGSVTLGLTSDGAGIDSLGTTALASQTAAVAGAVFAYAKPVLASTIVNFGVVHAGAAATQALTITDGTSNTAYTEALDAGFTGSTGSITTSGSISLLGAGKTNSTSLALGLSTATTGAFTGTAVLGLVSDGTGIDTLGTTALASQTITITGTVDNYATAALQQTSGSGTLTATGANAYTLNLGILQQGGSLTAGFGVLNSATGLADLLGGSLTAAGAGNAFTNSGLAAFSGLGAGQADTAPLITLSGTSTGSFSETITLSSAGSNASGYNASLANITLTVTGTVANSTTQATYSLTSGADTITGTGNDLILASAGQLSTGDVINGGPGANTLQLTGGGVFDLRAPSSITNVQLVQAQEGIGSLAQTIYLNAGFAGTVTAATGTAGAGITIFGNSDSATINLGAGNDVVYLGAATETVNGGGGNDTFYATAASIGATINGGTGVNQLTVSGGGTLAMGGNITNIGSVTINDTPATGTTPLVTMFTANPIANLVINGGAGNDTITAGAASQTINTGTGTSLINATAANAGVAISVQGSATLDITSGGNASLNAGDEFLTVQLSSATNLSLSQMSFITATGSSGNDSITALATQQTLTGGLGTDTLTGYSGFGDTFLDSAAGLNGDTIQYFGGNDLIDVTNLNRAAANLTYTGNATAGALSLSDGTHNAAIQLTNGAGFGATAFHLTSDGHGGTFVFFT